MAKLNSQNAAKTKGEMCIAAIVDVLPWQHIKSYKKAKNKRTNKRNSLSIKLKDCDQNISNNKKNATPMTKGQGIFFILFLVTKLFLPIVEDIKLPPHSHTKLHYSIYKET